jgi:succinate dehydrogenase / fumarate reductase, flavoprotein subunit
VVVAANRALEPFARTRGENPFAIFEDLQELMQAKVGIVRTGSDLEAALQELAALRVRLGRARVTGNREYNPGWHMWLDLDSMLTVSEAVTRAALERQESRGGHTREDFPDSEPDWGSQLIITRRSADGMTTVTEPVPAIPPEIQDLIAEGVPVA